MLKNEWIKYISKLEKVKEIDAVDKIITKEKNEVLYSELIQKFKHGIFSKRPNPVGDKLEKAVKSLAIYQSKSNVRYCVKYYN